MVEGDTPSTLAYCVLPYFGIAYCVQQFLASRTAYRLSTKNNHFGRFHLHKGDKMTVCRISGVSWHTPVRTCVRWTTEIRKIEKPEKLKMH